MSDLRPRGVPIVLDGEERHLLFTLNVICELQDRRDKALNEIMEELADEKKSPYAMREIVTLLLNDEAERTEKKSGVQHEKVTEREVGTMVAMDNYSEVMRAIFRAYGQSFPEPEDNDPNTESGTMSN